MHGHMNVKKMRGLMLIRNFLIKKTQEINSYVYVSKSWITLYSIPRNGMPSIKIISLAT